ncbi:MAG: type II secretion system protein GspN [Nitrospirae bacterium]|nr:type II secretion system protein GspN [Nitrospirota bacterium]
MKKILLAAFFIAVFVIGLWAVVVPEDMFLSRIEKTLKESGLSIETSGLKKGLFYNFEAHAVKLRKSDTTFLSIDNLAGKINPLSVVLMKLPLSVNANIGGGRMTGRIDLLGWKDSIDFRIDDAHIEGIPFFAAMGLGGSGTLSGTIKSKGGNVEFKFSVLDSKFAGGSFFGIMVPLDMFNNARGLVTINGNITRIDSLWLEGKGINARVKGNIAGNIADLTLELMQDASFVDRANILPLIGNYRVSPGYYVIPIKSSISF